MKRFAIVLAALAALYAAMPAGAQSPMPGANINSNVNGSNLTNGQTTTVGLVASWFSSVASQVGSLFTTQSPITSLFSSKSPPTALQAPSYTAPAGPYAVPNPQTMTSSQFMSAFGIYQLQPLKN
jgi:hypothetical protein